MSGSILNAFYLIYKTNAKEAIKENRDLEKSNKDVGKSMKDAGDEAEKLGASLEKIADKAASVVGGYIGFSVLKTGISDAIAFNTQLYTTGKIFDQNIQKLSTFVQAAYEAGGSKQGALSNLQSLSSQAAAAGLQFNAEDYLRNVRAQVKLQSSAAGRARVIQNAGISDTGLAMLAIASDSDFEDRIKKGALHAQVSDESAKNAFDANSEIAGSSGMLSTYFTKLTDATKPLIDGFTSLANALAAAASSSPAAAGATGAAGLAASWWGWKGLKALFGRGAAGAAGEAAAAGAGGVTAGEAAAAGGAAIGVAPLAIPLAWGGLLSYSGLSIPAVQNWVEKQLAEGADPNADYDLGFRKLSASKAAGAPVTGDMQFWMSKGYSQAQAAAIISNMRAESSGNPAARGDSGLAGGLFQWHPDRRANILKNTGIDVYKANAQQQMEAAAWEMQNGRPGFDDAYFRSLTDPGQAGAYFSRRFEAPASALEDVKRAQSALSIASQYSSMNPPSSGGSSVQVGKVEIHTQATDAAGIARDLKTELTTQLAHVQGNFDDGVAR